MPEVIINSPEGRLEARYHHSEMPGAPLALVLHPHPEYGGSMNNRVVYTAYRAFAELGFSVLRFNFRGVGRSQGVFDKGEGELSDSAYALDWLQAQNPNSNVCWVSGFSFGAWIAMQLMMRRPEVSGFVSIAPPTNMFDFSFLTPCPSSGLIISSEDDEIVPFDSVQSLVSKLTKQRGVRIDHKIIKGTDHFFRDKTHLIDEAIKEHVEGAIGPKEPEF